MQFCLLLRSSRTVEANQASLSRDTERGSLPADVSRLRLLPWLPERSEVTALWHKSVGSFKRLSLCVLWILHSLIKAMNRNTLPSDTLKSLASSFVKKFCARFCQMSLINICHLLPVTDSQHRERVNAQEELIYTTPRAIVVTWPVVCDVNVGNGSLILFHSFRRNFTSSHLSNLCNAWKCLFIYVFVTSNLWSEFRTFCSEVGERGGGITPKNMAEKKNITKYRAGKN